MEVLSDCFWLILSSAQCATALWYVLVYVLLIRLSTEQMCLTRHEDFSWGDGCVPSLTGWSYHAGGAIRGPGVIIHDGMELLV